LEPRRGRAASAGRVGTLVDFGQSVKKPIPRLNRGGRMAGTPGQHDDIYAETGIDAKY
jgi:hypothetical protein